MTAKLIASAAGFVLAMGSAHAIAADLIVETPMVAQSPTAASGFWDSFYIGVFGGFGAGVVEDVDQGFGLGQSPPPTENSFGIDGFLAGVKVGADTHITDNVVVGVVGDLAWANLAGGDYGVSFYRVDYDVNWVASLRGRVGYEVNGILPYLTAGLAVMNGTGYSDNRTISLGIADPTKTHIGWTAGAGVAVPLADTMTLEFEYRYSDYGEATYEDFRNGAIDTPLALTSHQFTVGLNWSF